uniref:BTB domain-containing protein n=1 Tax=Mesocestoides corti TaxID=53468 RepID=A0A5K3EWE1_MESCO
MCQNVTLENLLSFSEKHIYIYTINSARKSYAIKERNPLALSTKRKYSTTRISGFSEETINQKDNVCVPPNSSKSRRVDNDLLITDENVKMQYIPVPSLPDSTNCELSCCTKICPKKIEFTWTLDNFSLSATAPGETIVSRSFAASSNNDYVWSLRVAPHGKCPDLSDFVSVCLVMESKDDSFRPLQTFIQTDGNNCAESITNCEINEGHGESTATIPPASLIPARFRCSILDEFGRVAYSNETERYHLVGPKMGLGFCRFVERSRLYPHLKKPDSEISSQKGYPSHNLIPISTTSSTNDNEPIDSRLIGPGDRLSLFVEIFWIEEEIYASPEAISPGVNSVDDYDGSRLNFSELLSSMELKSDLERLLQSGRLADIKVVVVNAITQKSWDRTAIVDIHGLFPEPVACRCSDCETMTELFPAVPAHKAILAASSPKLLKIFFSKSDSLHKNIDVLVFRGTGLSADIAPVFLRCVYVRRLDKRVTHLQLVSLLRLASTLEMPDLWKIVEQRLMGILTPANVCPLLATASDLNAPLLVDACLSYIFCNMDSVMKSDGYQCICMKRPDLLCLLFRRITLIRSINLNSPSPPPPLATLALDQILGLRPSQSNFGVCSDDNRNPTCSSSIHGDSSSLSSFRGEVESQHYNPLTHPRHTTILSTKLDLFSGYSSLR